MWTFYVLHFFTGVWFALTHFLVNVKHIFVNTYCLSLTLFFENKNKLMLMQISYWTGQNEYENGFQEIGAVYKSLDLLNVSATLILACLLS